MTLSSKVTAFLLAASSGVSLMGQEGAAPRIYIEPQDGLESYVAAVMVKKHVPAIVTERKDEARFVLTGIVQAKPESTGGKITRCLFLYCAGIQGAMISTVQLIDKKTEEVVWAYTVNKGSAAAYQSSAESIAST
jgi:hypothetical protein